MIISPDSSCLQVLFRGYKQRDGLANAFSDLDKGRTSIRIAGCSSMAMLCGPARIHINSGTVVVACLLPFSFARCRDCDCSRIVDMLKRC